VIDALVDPAIPLLPPGQPYEKIKPMYQGLAADDSELARRALAHLRRDAPTMATTTPGSASRTPVGGQPSRHSSERRCDPACGPMSSMPPSTTMDDPVTYPPAGLASIATTAATSFASRGGRAGSPAGRPALRLPQPTAACRFAAPVWLASSSRSTTAAGSSNMGM
jgi:hypothetical protein